MKNIFHLALIVAPLAALVFFFSLVGQREVKVNQELDKAIQRIESEKFDQQFDAAWNGSSNKLKRQQQSRKMAELQKDLRKAKSKKDELDSMFENDTQDIRNAIQQEDARIAREGVSHVHKQ